MNSEVMFSSKTDMWETPQDFFDALDQEFHFTLDVCATPENAKCARYYTPEQNDELFDYLMCDVDSITVSKDKSLLIRVRDEHYNKPLEEQYECTGGWKVSDPKTRPFKFSNEMEDWEYHG